MRWPWIARDDRIASVITEFARQTSELDRRWQSRYDDLLEKYHELKITGAAPLEPTKVLAHRELDPVTAAITAKAGADKRLRSMMSREAMHARQLGMPDHEIIAQIEHGVEWDEGVPS